MLFIPAKTLLRFDRRTGHSLYVGAPDEETALRRARRFYRNFGLVFLSGGPGSLDRISQLLSEGLPIKLPVFAAAN